MTGASRKRHRPPSDRPRKQEVEQILRRRTLASVRDKAWLSHQHGRKAGVAGAEVSAARPTPISPHRRLSRVLIRFLRFPLQIVSPGIELDPLDDRLHVVRCSIHSQQPRGSAKRFDFTLDLAHASSNSWGELEGRSSAKPWPDRCVLITSWLCRLGSRFPRITGHPAGRQYALTLYPG